MSADPKRMAALAIEALPPPDRLKKRPAPPMDEGEGAPDDEAAEDADSSDRAGIMAMEDFEAATTPAEKFAALKRAIEACGE